jgi:putative transcriptional regulator
LRQPLTLNREILYNTLMVKNRLKEIRMKEYMMNQQHFCELLEINYRQYSRYEHGAVPSLEVAFKISQKLNKTIDEVFHYSAE